jgi:hypothetical protein
MGRLRVILRFEPKSVTLTFKHYFNGVGFGGLTVPDFRLVKSPWCDLLLFHVVSQLG